MKSQLASEYAAVVFEDNGEVVADALFREEPGEVCLRQLFVLRNQCRQGIRRQAVEILRIKIWPTNKRLTVEVLGRNTIAIAFWRAVGYKNCCLTPEILPGTATT
ncbi:MAG TPA: hypothetical protein VED19_01520 [Candidatus Nitrosopolaris sp.]|nr:hypothetical protein [Candidatus Nitrosopolaris sp.]